MKTKILLLSLLLSISIFSFAQQDPPFNENFDASSDMPADWTLETSTYGWLVKNWGYTAPNSLSVPFSATPKNDWAITPGLNLINSKTYIIEFLLKAPGWDGVPEALELKAGTAATSADMTEDLWSDNNLVVSQYSRKIFSFTPTTTGIYYFGWHAFSAANVDYISIDDIYIYETHDTDVEILNSSLPSSDLLGNSPNSSINITNLGASAITFDVELKVNDGTSDIHTETVNVTDLAIAEARQIDFADFTPTSEGTYTYTYTATVSGTDATPANNILSKEVTIIDGCFHKIVLHESELAEGWFGATISVSTNGITVLDNVTLINGGSVEYTFPSSTDADIEITYSNTGDIPEYCNWEVFDGENNLLISGIGDETGNVITQNTTGHCAPVSINNISENKIKISPNPTSNKINIIANENYKLTVVNITGKEILKTNINNNSEIYIKEKGILFLKFNNKNETIIKRVVVE